MRYAILFLPLAVLLAACNQIGTESRSTEAQSVSSNVPASAASTGLPDFTSLVKNTGSAVVNITTTRKPQVRGPDSAFPGRPGDPFFEFFRRFMPDAPQGTPQSYGVGSGFIISKDGYVLTNAHVVAGASAVTVRLAESKREFKARVIGTDRRTDVALLKVEASDLPTVKTGNSEQLAVGEWVAAIGSPFGFDNTITAGIVSAKKRTLPDEYFVPFIQTDVAVNPGNSGGPLLNLKGEVVGINSMIYSGTGGYMGVSFAIPIEVALDIGKQLQTTGKVTRGRLGVAIQSVTPELAQSFRLEKPIGGAIVTRVDPATAAAKAGLQAGDVILRYNGEVIDDANELPRLVANTKPGAAATLEIWRQGASRTVNATIGEFPAETIAAAGPAAAPAKANRLGLGVSVLPPEQRKALGVKFGLVIESIDPASEAPQLERGDVIVGINNAEFSSVEEFNAIVAKLEPGSSAALLVRRGDAARYIAVKVQG